jgi:hypothetical protein
VGGRRRFAAGYLGLQAAAVVGWWAALALSPRVRDWFEMDPARPDVLTAFAAGDAVVLGAGSLAAAVGLVRGAGWAASVAAFVAGGAACATLLLAAWVALGGRGAVGLAPMGAATAASLAVMSAAARPADP